jgi:tetratricopeptide (TPR) repeat protein
MNIKFSKNSWILTAAIILFTALAYMNSIGNDFVWDDHYLIVENDFVKSWDNFPLLFSRKYLSALDQISFVGQKFIGSGEISYRPVSTLTFFIDYHFWGLNPFGFHLTNIFLHIINSILLFFFLYKLLNQKMPAFITALLFALHPVNSEAVAVINFREDLLAMFFLLSSLILYVSLRRALKLHRILLYILSIILYLLALFSKEMAITLPAILILLDHCFPPDKKLPAEKTKSFLFITRGHIGYILASLFFLWVWFFPMARDAGSVWDYFYGHGLCRFLTMAKVAMIYLSWMIVPLNIHATILDFSIIECSLWRLKVVFSFLAWILLTLFIVRSYKKSKPCFFGIMWFLITLTPVMNILLMPNILALRFLYIPSAGFCICAIMLGKELYAKQPPLFLQPSHRRILTISLIAILVFFASLTFIQGYTWRDDLAFQSDRLAFYPNNATTNAETAQALQQRGFEEEAMAFYEQSLRLNPCDPEVRYALGFLYLKQGLFLEARHQFNEILKLTPESRPAKNNLCIILGEQQLYDEAVACFLEIIRQDRQNVDAYAFLATTYKKMGELQKAEEILKEGLANKEK